MKGRNTRIGRCVIDQAIVWATTGHGGNRLSSVVFAGGINRCHHDDVGIVETGAEFLKMMAQPGVTVWLMHGDDAPFGRLPRGLKHSSNLNRVVAVIVDDRHPINLAHLGKAPVDATEGGQRGPDLIHLHAEMPRDGDSGQRV